MSDIFKIEVVYSLEGPKQARQFFSSLSRRPYAMGSHSQHVSVATQCIHSMLLAKLDILHNFPLRSLGDLEQQAKVTQKMCNILYDTYP